MQRSKIRKFEKMAETFGLAKSENVGALEEALSGCRNGVTRARLRSRILRGK